MLTKIIIIASFFLFFNFFNCGSSNDLKTFNFDADTPKWLKEKISVITNKDNSYNDLTKVFRYKWNDTFIYHITNPLNSCLYCELFDQDGIKIVVGGDTTLQDILFSKKGEVLIWEKNKNSYERSVK